MIRAWLTLFIPPIIPNLPRAIKWGWLTGVEC
jgi:hypothetical protein